MRADFSALFYLMKREKERSDIMKKKVNPSPILLIFSAVVIVIALVFSVHSFKKGYGMTGSDITLCISAVALSILSVYNFIMADRIEFDETTFTVDKNTYSYADITNVKVDSEIVMRYVSTLRIEIYVGDSRVCRFTKNGKGAKEFIECMKNQGIAISI